MLPLLAIGPAPLQLEHVAAAVAAGSEADADGAVVTFLGLVRNHNLGRSVRYLEYEAYEPLALKAFARISAEIGERWPTARLALHHRIGRLEVGEASVAYRMVISGVTCPSSAISACSDMPALARAVA